MIIRFQAQGNLCEGSRTSLQGRGGTTTVCKSPTTSTLRKSSRTFDRSWIVRTDTWSRDQCIDPGFFLSTTLKASVHLGPNYNENLVTYRNVVRQRAEVILEHVFEILNVSRIEWTFFSWMRSTLHHDKVMKWAKAKVHVKWDSVLFLGKIQEHSEANAKCKDQLQRLPTVQRMRWIRVKYSRDTRDRNLSESWTGFTQFALLNEKTSWKEHVLWGAAHDNSSNCQTWSVVARKLAQYVKSSSTKGKASMSYRESEARPCWKVERHLFICPDDKSMVEKPLKNARKKLEFPTEAAMSCELKTTKSSYQHREIKSGSNKI